MRRWLLRILIFVGVLLVIAAVAIQFVLWSDIPQRMVLKQLQRDTGLRIVADRLRTGWGGSSNLENLRIALPGEDEPFAIAESARIEHASLIPLIIGSDIKITEIHLDKLSVKLVQDAAGRWTFERIGALAEPAPAAGTGDPQADPYASIKLVRITGARLEVVDAQGRRSVVEPIDLSADANIPGTLEYQLSAAAPGDEAQVAQATGHVVMRGQWPHRVNLHVATARRLIGDWLGDLPGDVDVHLDWEGRFAEGGVRGRVVIEHGTAAGYAVEGAATIRSDAAGTYIEPRDLRVELPAADDQIGQAITLHSGAVSLAHEVVTLERVEVTAADVRARVSGQYEIKTETGRLTGEWTGKMAEQVAAHGGSFEGAISRTLTGLDLRVNAASTGQIAAVKWNSTIALAAKGPQWTQLDWSVSASDGELVIDAGGAPDPKVKPDLVQSDRAWPTTTQKTGPPPVPPLRDEAATNPKNNSPEQTFTPLAQFAVPREDEDTLRVRPPLRPADERGDESTPEDKSQAPSLTTRPRRIPLTGLAITGRIRWPLIHLDRFRHSGAGTLFGDGMFDADTRQWQANIEGKAVELSAGLPKTDIDIVVQGTDEQIRVERAILSGEQHHVSLHGTYSITGSGDSPVSMRMKATWWDTQTGPLPPEPPSFAQQAGNVALNPPAIEQPASAHPQTPEKVSAWAGRISLEGAVSGRVEPMALRIDGRLNADALRLNGQAIRALAMDIRGRVIEDRFTARSGSFEVMDGNARMDLDYVLGGEGVDMRLHLDVVSLEALLRMVDPKLAMKGRSSAKLDITIPVKSPREMIVNGDWSVDDVSFREFGFERLTGRLWTRRPGLIEMNPIEAFEKSGHARGAMAVDLRSGVTGQLKLTLSDWPVDYEPQQLHVTLDGGAAVNIDFIAAAFAGSFDLDAQTEIANARFGTLRLVGEARADRIDLRLDGTRLLNGDASGKMTLMLQEWWKSTGYVEWKNIAPAALVPWVPQLAEVEGSTKGSITFAPSPSAKAHEPLEVQLSLKPVEKLTYRRVPFGPVKARVFGGRTRWLMDEMEATLAGGRAVVWASLHERGEQWHDHVVLRFSDLNLDELRLVFPDETYNEPTPGRVSGHLTAYGEISEWSSHGGGGTVRLVDSNLKNTDVMGRVLGAFNANRDEPVGAGLIDLRFERAALWIDRLIYRNRSTEILLNARVDDLREGMKSKITGDALGSLRLIDSDDAGTWENADRLLRAFQSNATAVTIRGTLDDPIIEQTIMRDVGRFFDRMLGPKPNATKK